MFGYLIGIGQEKRVIIGYRYWLKKIHIVHPWLVVMVNKHSAYCLIVSEIPFSTIALASE